MPSGARPTSMTLKRSSNFKRQKKFQTIGMNFFASMPSSLGNRFSALADNTEMDLEAESNIVESKVIKPPPVVADATLIEVQKLFGKDYTYKSTSTGIKIFSSSKEKLEYCKKLLLEKKIPFHSYNSKENRLYTIFLYGLPKISTDEIINDLKSYNLNPASVSEIETQFSSPNNAVYKVQFVRKSFNPKSLLNVKSICNVIISWRKYKQRKKENPTQCWNCLMYGHGGEHCHRQSACMICASTHHTGDCPLNKRDKKPAVFTCFNCKKEGKERTDHSANDINCPSRATYLEQRAKATMGSRRNDNGRRAAQPNSQRRLSAPHHNNINMQSYVNGNSYASQLRDNNNLFNIDELFQIFTSALNDLQNCTTKLQQIQVVMSMVKYAYELP